MFKTLLRSGQSFLVIVAAGMIGFPLFWMLMTSLKPGPEVAACPPSLLPVRWTITPYVKVLSSIPFLRFFFNSTLCATVAALSSAATSLAAGYIFAKYRFMGREMLFTVVLAGMMIPEVVLIIPNYLLFRHAGMTDTLWALIVPSLVSPFGIFLARQYLLSLPDELIDAARIDGCSEFGAYWRIVVPLSKSVIGSILTFTFLWNWDSFLWPLIVIDSLEKRTLPLGLALFSQQMFGIGSYNTLMAGATITAAPVCILFLVTQRQITQSIMLSGLKG